MTLLLGHVIALVVLVVSVSHLLAFLLVRGAALIHVLGVVHGLIEGIALK